MALEEYKLISITPEQPIKSEETHVPATCVLECDARENDDLIAYNIL